MILRIFIFVLLLLAGIISASATVNADRIGISSSQDFGPVRINRTHNEHLASQPKSLYASSNTGENFEDVTKTLSLALFDVIKLTGNNVFGAHQFNGFSKNPSSSATPMIIEGNYSQNSSQDTVLIDAHIKFSVPSNTYMGKMYLNLPYSFDFSDFGACTKDYQIFTYAHEDAVPFPAAVYLLGTGLIVLCLFAHKNRAHP